MRFRAVRPSQLGKVDAIVVPLFAGAEPPAWLSRPTRAAIARLLKEERGVTRLYGVNTLYEEPRVVIVGAGKPGQLDAERARNIASAGVRALWRSSVRKVGIAVAPDSMGEERAAQAAVEGAIYAMWRPEAHRTREEERRLPNIDQVLLVTEKAVTGAIDRGIAIGEATNVARRLANEPANRMTPTLVAEAAKELAKEAGVRIEVLDAERCRALGMGSFLSVAQGSHEPPRFIVMRHRGRGGSGYDLGLVGKGITFDSGGISIKPAEKMEEMKFDMCGAAAVIGTIEAAAKLELPIKITGAIPSTDNLPSGSAYKPGDIITMMSGKTVEIVNTDAEGRMILADALHYASELKPDHLIDYATLTGACVVALASEAAGLFSNDDELARKLIESGERVGERLWRMPVWDDYKDLIRSEWADMKNSGGRWGGAITAALFLKEYVNCPSWAHLDIAGTAYAEQETAREARGATGAGVRVTVAFLELLSRS